MKHKLVPTTEQSIDLNNHKRLRMTLSTDVVPEPALILPLLPSELRSLVMDFIPTDEPSFVNFGVTCKSNYKVFENHPRSLYFYLKRTLPQTKRSCIHTCHYSSYLSQLKQLIEKEENKIKYETERQQLLGSGIIWRDTGVANWSQMTSLTLEQRTRIFDSWHSRVQYTLLSHSTASHYDDYACTAEITAADGRKLVLDCYGHDDDCEIRFTVSVAGFNSDQQTYERNWLIKNGDSGYRVSSKQLNKVRAITGIGKDEVDDNDMLSLVLHALPHPFYTEEGVPIYFDREE